MSYIQTYSGNKFDLANCSVDDIKIRDIAHSLALVNRFAGHTKEPYSVGQHSIICALEAKKRGCDDWYTLSMLMHDAAEAYVCDIPKHIKEYLGEAYETLENNVAEAIALKYGTMWPISESLKQIDYDVLETEFRDVMNGSFPNRPVYGRGLPFAIIPVRWDVVEREFLRTFERYGGSDG